MQEKERHLHRTTASTSAAASTQSLDTCSKRAVTKPCVHAAVAHFICATGTTFWGSGGLVAAKFVKCPKSYYTEQYG